MKGAPWPEHLNEVTVNMFYLKVIEQQTIKEKKEKNTHTKGTTTNKRDKGNTRKQKIPFDKSPLGFGKTAGISSWHKVSVPKQRHFGQKYPTTKRLTSVSINHAGKQHGGPASDESAPATCPGVERLLDFQSRDHPKVQGSQSGGGIAAVSE